MAAADAGRPGPALHALGSIRPGGGEILSIVNLFLAIFLSNPDLDQVIAIMDTFLVVIFLIDFVRRLRVATDDRAYVIKGRGWLDLVSIVPMLRIARRLLRILRVIRITGHMGGPEAAVRTFFRNRASAGLYIVLLLALVVLEFGSIAMLWAERVSPDANITTADDALWYSIVTMSTVGYGDQYPVTDLGRLIGTLVIILGVAVFGTLTGFLANAFLAPKESEGHTPVRTEPSEPDG